jgi:nitrite reductase (cytochrome c-552)
MSQDKTTANAGAGFVTRRRFFAAMFALAAVAAGAAVLAGYLLIDITAKKHEARNPFFRVVELNENIDDPATWGKNFPLQFDRYKRSVDMVRTRFGGSEAMPRTPDQADPRSVVARSKLERDPRLKTLWAGYSFAVDYRERRGHAYMLEDQLYTKRQTVAKQPGACLNCHASMTKAYREVGGGDIDRGFEKLNAMPYAEARQHVQHAVACIDCHDPQTMQLRITRPAFIAGIRAYKASQNMANYDVNTMATRQEMRSYVCAQCHVDYYFEGPEKRLTFPWNNGLRVEQILQHLEDINLKEWVHADTGAPLLKARHPEFETWSQGVHARAGVACADCHMPYLREGALKISDHHVRSPLLNVNNACQTCHRVPETELKGRVEEIQERFFALRNETLDALVGLIGDIKAAKAAGRPDDQLAAAMSLQRKAGFLFDMVEAENSVGFHAPQETVRILGLAMDLARQGQIAVRDPHFQPQFPKYAPFTGQPPPT